MAEVAREQGSERETIATPDQIMIGVVATLAERLGPGGGVEPDGLENLTRAITEAICSAMAAEREACAKIADKAGMLNLGIVAAIRARGAK